MKLDRVEFLWSSEEIKKLIVLVSCNGYSSKEYTSADNKVCYIHELTATQILYPYMQCADIFFLIGFLSYTGLADICQLGMDQRKVNVLAREYCDAIKRKKTSPTFCHITCFLDCRRDRRKCHKVIHPLPF
ncbi:unnamed protein product [Musa hybrid cultivar]